jgi:hypothetical protein
VRARAKRLRSPPQSDPERPLGLSSANRDGPLLVRRLRGRRERQRRGGDDAGLQAEGRHGAHTFARVIQRASCGWSQTRRPQSATAKVVAAGRADQRCPRSRARCLHVRRSATNRPLVEAFRAAEHAPEGAALPIRDVDAQSLHQPCWPHAAREQTTGARAREAGVARGLWQDSLMKAGAEGFRLSIFEGGFSCKVRLKADPMAIQGAPAGGQ